MIDDETPQPQPATRVKQRELGHEDLLVERLLRQLHSTSEGVHSITTCSGARARTRVAMRHQEDHSPTAQVVIRGAKRMGTRRPSDPGALDVNPGALTARLHGGCGAAFRLMLTQKTTGRPGSPAMGRLELCSGPESVISFARLVVPEQLSLEVSDGDGNR